MLMMYKVFLRFPEALRPAFPRLKEKLEDPDSGKTHFLIVKIANRFNKCKKIIDKQTKFTTNFIYP